MRYFIPRFPEIKRILVVESGSRRIIESAVANLKRALGEHVEFDLVTCFPGLPAAMRDDARVWRTQEFRDNASRRLLLLELQGSSATVLAILCSGEPVMNLWKLWLAWRLPMKILIINENADCFWLDAAHLRVLTRFILVRAGLAGDVAGRTLVRLAVLPFLFLYLLLFAMFVHMRRALRLGFARE